MSALPRVVGVASPATPSGTSIEMDDLFALAIATLGLLIVAGIAFLVGRSYGRADAVDYWVDDPTQDAGA